VNDASETSEGHGWWRRAAYRGPRFDDLHEGFAKRHRIDPHAPLTSSSEIDIARPVDVVWSVLADPLRWPSWAPHTRDVRLEAPVAVDVPFVWTLGAVRIHATLAVVAPGRELSWTGAAMWTRAVDRNALTARGDGTTRLLFEESLSGVGVPLLYSRRRLRRQHEAWLSAVKAAAEAR
jgi:hypothetical protein